MILNETFTLKNDVTIPKLGLGTWLIPDESVTKSVEEAFQVGYRHIDTAQAYKNEVGVGKAIKSSDIKREELFITTKLSASIKTYKEAVEAIDGSLTKLGLEYADLMLIHSPQPWDDLGGAGYEKGNREAWRALEDAYKAGKMRSIGISNFKEEDIENILTDCKVVPMVNQLLVHIGDTPESLIKYCQDKDILVEAYSPIAHGDLLKNTEVKEIADKYKVSIAQLCIRYALQLDTLPLPKTTNIEHMRVNTKVDFIISDSDMEALKQIK
ncbi:MAG: aldo/keto reductase [Micrococcaceae bacterium]